MSVNFDISKISFFGLDDWSVAVCAWRGCCLEVFARAEHSVADCLRALERSGITMPKDARHAFAATRLKSLRVCIENLSFGGHGKAALARIDQWERVYETRAMLAHGEIKVTPQGIAIRHITFDGKAEKQLPVKQMSRIEMLQALAEMEEAQKFLRHQLGQIKALALSKEPNPGSSPG